jgi:SAM-dependent methyltransferase
MSDGGPLPPGPCRICGATTHPLGTRHGTYSGRDYTLWRCERCRYAFVGDPWTDFAAIYDDAYYLGRGADPLVDYQSELDEPDRTVRIYEWRGVTRLAERLQGDLSGLRWLDFGAGNGGLVRYVRGHTTADAEGYENGAIAAQAQARGIPMHGRLEDLEGGYDLVTAIEVLEHVLDPVAELRRIRSLMRPGGLLLLTTGNAEPFADALTEWSYVIPEIHVSFFEPATLRLALSEAGFRPASMPASSGFDDVLKFKVLKNLGIRRRSAATDLLPARPVAALADHRRRLRAHPIGWAV